MAAAPLRLALQGIDTGTRRRRAGARPRRPRHRPCSRRPAGTRSSSPAPIAAPCSPSSRRCWAATARSRRMPAERAALQGRGGRGGSVLCAPSRGRSPRPLRRSPPAAFERRGDGGRDRLRPHRARHAGGRRQIPPRALERGGEVLIAIPQVGPERLAQAPVAGPRQGRGAARSRLGAAHPQGGHAHARDADGDPRRAAGPAGRGARPRGRADRRARGDAAEPRARRMQRRAR